jgi:hypothetical protein
MKYFLIAVFVVVTLVVSFAGTLVVQDGRIVMVDGKVVVEPVVAPEAAITWLFNENGLASTTIADLSGNSLTGDARNRLRLTPPFFGKAPPVIKAVRPSTHSYCITYGDQAIHGGDYSKLDIFGHDWSWGTWVKIDGSPLYLMGKGYWGNVGAWYSYALPQANHRGSLRLASTTYNVTASGATINDGQWHFISCSFDNANNDFFVYVDGILRNQNLNVTASDTADNNYHFSMGGFMPNVNDVGNESNSNLWFSETMCVSGLVSTAQWSNYVANGTLPTNLVLHWGFTNTAAGFYRAEQTNMPSVWSSIGQIYQPLWTNYNGNGCVLIDTVDDFMLAGKFNFWRYVPGGLDDKLTVSLWANPTDIVKVPNYSNTILNMGGYGGSQTGYEFRLAQSFAPVGSFRIVFRSLDDVQWSATTTNVWPESFEGTWHHVVWTLDLSKPTGSKVQIYLDGEAQVMDYETLTHTTVPATARYGYWWLPTSTAARYSGFIDTVEVDNHVWNAEEVRQKYLQGRR